MTTRSSDLNSHTLNLDNPDLNSYPQDLKNKAYLAALQLQARFTHPNLGKESAVFLSNLSDTKMHIIFIDEDAMWETLAEHARVHFFRKHVFAELVELFETQADWFERALSNHDWDILRDLYQSQYGNIERARKDFELPFYWQDKTLVDYQKGLFQPYLTLDKRPTPVKNFEDFEKYLIFTQQQKLERALPSASGIKSGPRL